MSAAAGQRPQPDGGRVDAGSLDVQPSDDALAARVERECRAQGVPVGLDDPAAINAILTLLRDWTATDPEPQRRNRRQKRPLSEAPARAKRNSATSAPGVP